jgi:hypothetical protein
LFAVGQVFGWLTAERDMANIDIGWEIESSQISPEESVRGMLGVISTKDVQQSGSFWTWDNRVSTPLIIITTLFSSPTTSTASSHY